MACVKANIALAPGTVRHPSAPPRGKEPAIAALLKELANGGPA
jgi:hypothetical protein